MGKEAESKKDSRSIALNPSEPPSGDTLVFARACMKDVSGILRLQALNLRAAGGMLSAEFSRQWFATWIDVMPTVVARHGQEVIGYLISSPIAANGKIAIVQKMLACIEVPSQPYIYGPICVADEYRQTGVARRMYAFLREQCKDMVGLTFIRQDNCSSLKAHRQLEFTQLGSFDLAGVPFVALRAP